MNILGVAELASGAVAVVVFLGATVVYFRGSRDKGTIATLEASNAALTERVEILKSDVADMKSRLDFLEAENAELHRQRPSAEAIAEVLEVVENTASLLAAHDARTTSTHGKASP